MALQTLPFPPETALGRLFPPLDYRDDRYSALFFEANNVCLVVLRKGLKHDSFGVMEARARYFDHCRCYTSIRYQEIDAAHEPGEASLDTIGLLMTPSNAARQTDRAQFWQGTVFVTNGVAIRLLENQFRASPTLEQGFEYRYEAIVLRGHARHQAGETSALAEVRGDFERVIDRAQRELPIPQAQVLQTAAADLGQVRTRSNELCTLVAQPLFRQEDLMRKLDAQLEALFRQTEQIARLRLIQQNPATDEQIQRAKAQAERYVREQVSPLVQQGFWAPRVTGEQVAALENGLDAYRRALDVLRGIAADTASRARQQELQRVWTERVNSFSRIVREDAIVTAHGPIIRIYQEVPVTTPAQLLTATWHLCSSILDTQDQTRFESYLPNAEYRAAFLALMADEIALYRDLEAVGLSKPENPTAQLQERLDELNQMHDYWVQFEGLPSDRFRLDRASDLTRELAQKFNGTVSRPIPFYWLFHQEGNGFSRRLETGHIERVLPFLFRCIDLVDRKLELSGHLEVSAERVRYPSPNSNYASRRKRFDAELFVVLTNYLQAVVTSAAPTPLMTATKQAIHKLISRVRSYGPLDIRWEPVLPAKQLASRGSALNSALNLAVRVGETLRPFEPATAGNLEQMTGEADAIVDALGAKADEILEHLRQDDPAQAWWDRYHTLIQEQNQLVADITAKKEEIRVELAGVAFDADSFQAARDAQQQTLLTTLRRLRTLEPRRSSLATQINALDSISRQDGADRRLNRGIVDARQTVESLQERLRQLRRPTPYDQEVRDEAISQLDHVQATLTPGGSDELFTRLRQIKDALVAARGSDSQADIEAALQAQIATLPSAADLPSLATQRLDCLTALSRARGLSQALRTALRSVEIAEAITQTDRLLATLSRYYCDQWRTSFERHTQGLSLDLIKREWIARHTPIEVRSHYTWKHAPQGTDPHYRANDTHIRI